MTELRFLEDRATAHFNLREYRPLDDRNLRVRLRFNYAVAAKVKEPKNRFIEEMEVHPDGLDVVLRVRQLDELMPWVLGLGANAGGSGA
ncbi:WYL domain-containing protein [Bacillus sp. FJAT-26390]|uniref:WYL domain-containing protein n=1 Tax=Bacillus sp. FJAT-26390 TaxID=1743142 RepID=UPI001146E555